MARDGITKMISNRTGKTSWRARISWVDDANGITAAGRFAPGTPPASGAASSWPPSIATTGSSRNPPRSPMWPNAGWPLCNPRGRRRHYGRITPGTPERSRRSMGIASITPSELQAWYDTLSPRYTSNTVAQIHKVMRGILGHAVTDGIIRVNPADGRRLPRDRRPPPTVSSTDEARRFRDVATGDPNGALFVFMLATGMRLGEALALHWPNIDLDARTARIHRTVQVLADGPVIADAPKTASSRRTVVLPATAVMLVRGMPRRSMLVFPDAAGHVLSPVMARHHLTGLCTKAGVPRLSPHGLRRTAATLMLQQGVHPRIAAEQLGHSVEMMLTLYAQVSTVMQEQAANALDDALGWEPSEERERR